MSYDIKIKNAKIIDGAGNPWYAGDIGIKEGRIVKIRPRLTGDAIKEIDGTGLITCPGFIDIHSHTDTVLPFFKKKIDSSLRQGITTSVVGMCGEGIAPIPPEKLEFFKEHLKPPSGGDMKITWDTYGSYLDEMGKFRVPANFIFVVGFGTIRIAGGPGFEDRPPTTEEYEKMKALVAEAMESGAFGMSTGLIYAPQVFAKTEEVIELAKVVANYNGLYFSHIRGEGNSLIKAVKEVIEIVEKSGCVGGQIAHHKVAGKAFWGDSKATLKLIEDANARGVSITYDQYPYNRGQSGLVTTLPPWAREGGNVRIMERLQDPQDQERIRKDILEGGEDWENWIKINGFNHLYISHVKNKRWKEVEGKSISEITNIKGMTDDFKTYFELMIDEEAGIPITIESMCDEDIRRIMTGRYHMVGTDSSGMPLIPGSKLPHPRTFGTYPRVLGKYVREEKLLILEDAIRRMTSFPAQRLGLRDRGLLREGMWADIVIFDPNTVMDKATYLEPCQFPEGILHIIVNGEIVVENDKQVRKYPGKVLRRPI